MAIPMSRLLTAALSCALLVACGGGGSSLGSGSAPGGGSGGGSGNAPTPTPTGGAGTAGFTATAVGPLLARVTIDTNGSGIFGDAGDALSSTAIDGRFGRNIATLAPQIHTGSIPTSANRRMEATGVDALTGLFFSQMRAPVGATVISPLTALIDAAGSESRVRTALGLDQGPDALRGQIGLTTFNPVANLGSSNADDRHNAAILLRLNLRLLTMAAVLKDTNGDPVDLPVNLLDGSRYMAQEIAATGRLDLTDPATLVALLGRSRYQFSTTIPEHREALATFIARANAAIPNDLATPDQVRGWALSFRFELMPEFQTLASGWANPAAPRILAIDTASMAQFAAEFAADPAPVPGAFMAVPDYREVRVPDDETILRDCNGTLSLPSCNDQNPFTFDRATTRIISADTSAPNSLVVDLDPLFRLRRLGVNFRGLVRVPYTTEFANGTRVSGMLYARVLVPGR